MAQKTIYRSDYRAPSHLIDEVRLEFDLDAESTAVKNTMSVRPNPNAKGETDVLFLNGEDLTLVSISLDGVELSEDHYTVRPDGIEISGIRKPVKLTAVNRFSPKANTALSGIYASGTSLMSQCEAEGFRRITYFPDRPDILAK